MVETLNVVINTLRNVSVMGEENMERMLGCINCLKQLVAMAQNPEEKTEEVSNG